MAQIRVSLLFELFYYRQNQDQQVYHIGVAKETTSVPATLQNMMDGFNLLNQAIRGLLMDAEEVANNVSTTPCQRGAIKPFQNIVHVIMSMVSSADGRCSTSSLPCTRM